MITNVLINQNNNHTLVNASLLIYTIVLISILSMFFFRNQILISLITLEITVLSLFITIIIQFNQFHQPVSICFYILILGACEASIALTLLVIITRINGNDLLSTISTQNY